MAACLLTEGVSKIKNVPYLKDIKTMSDVLRVVGCRVSGEPHVLEVDASRIDHFEAPYELVKTMRASFYVLGALLGKYKKAKVSLPGGCAWGPRPVDMHLKAFEAMGAKINIKNGYVLAEAARLRGAEINFPNVSVGATANVLMAASMAEGETVLNNSSIEPEVVNLAEMLKAMGADIELNGNVYKINGKKELSPCEIEIIPDRIEAGTFMAACAGIGGNIKIEKCLPPQLSSSIDILRRLGAQIEKSGPDALEVSMEGVPGSLDVETHPYPGFPTDMQAQIMAILSVAEGRSIITDTIYHDRFTHVAELMRLGADIEIRNNTAVINGVGSLTGASVMATDLRASAALVIAGLMAEGETQLSRVYHIDRGYEKIEKKFAALGAEIKRDFEPMQS